MMGMVNFRDTDSYLHNEGNKVQQFYYVSVSIAQTVFCEGRIVLTSTLNENVMGGPVPCQSLASLNIIR